MSSTGPDSNVRQYYYSSLQQAREEWIAASLSYAGRRGLQLQALNMQVRQAAACSEAMLQHVLCTLDGWRHRLLSGGSSNAWLLSFSQVNVDVCLAVGWLSTSSMTIMACMSCSVVSGGDKQAANKLA